MSDQEIYEIVERRIDQRNRRRLLWAIDLTGLVLALAALIVVGNSATNPVYENWAAALFVGWGGVFTLHSISLWLAETRQNDIDSEVARLRQTDYEKPKRLELSEEGELVDPHEWAMEDDQRRRNLTSR
jgi:hypothetical protein